MIEPPLASVAMIAIAFIAVPMRRPATQYSSREAKTLREASKPMPMHDSM
jgi:hypothetical protein